MDKILYSIKKLIPQKIFSKIQPAYHFVLAWLAAVLHRFPSNKLIVIGVTGTTGKSTSVHLIAKTLESAGYKVGYTSTAMFKVADKEWMNDKKMTMPGRFFTQSMLRRMVKAGCEYAIIETTSQGIEQFRHRFINYDILVFTGLYPEHIEAHGGFENYKLAKGKLFAHLARCKPKYVNAKKKVQLIKNEIKKIHSERVKKTVIVNQDDKYAEYFLSFKAEQKITFQRAKIKFESNEYLVSNRNLSGEGISFTINETDFKLRLAGAFNLYNALAAVSAGLSQDLDLDKIKKGLESVSGVPGRFERIDEGQNFLVIVDYAFEPNAVSKLYEIISQLPHRRIIQVLGSTGGGRDISRRPLLGKIAGEKADIVVITNEDPYDDDPQIIIDQVAVGAEKSGKTQNHSAGQEQSLFKILDRREAIRKALRLAREGDVVLITGKGCEQAMCLSGGKKIPWDDRQTAREELGKISG
ncbi:hypothetical protein COT99_04465 [Candidatus Falkowbacteria bacterium CG10_big_fil_rev_8_21_14_0_10_43_10]|uniref:UDP-N-acetylmuramoyl-L-alanyl-D-glutamate--2, 6-diaminopimelate ligase n=1 Tax=Candidatus Falkowbacteria bacterium CG10_big_fil_rev_8_21_14_0_10_43_10 TaxID=1974567 RepID=A0A2H0V365_9BACT|nr:MAG: hypothetical protein COT99_04465 [Candidatus Falkowbacteria bacterium CG10_big_fil_rev_8_21_14_0_10_43_10]